MTSTDKANEAFRQAAQADKGKGYGGPVPSKPRNLLHKANQELLQIGNRRKVFVVCPNCNDKGCDYCGPAE